MPRWTAPTTGTYLVLSGEQPRLLTDEELAALDDREAAMTIRFEVDEYETRAFQTSGASIALGKQALSSGTWTIFHGWDHE